VSFKNKQLHSWPLPSLQQVNYQLRTHLHVDYRETGVIWSMQ